MKKILFFPVIASLLVIYFVMSIFVLPEQFLEKEQLISQPYFEAKLSKSEISLGESTSLEIKSKNIGEYGDIHIVSTAFPDIDNTDSIIKIVSYDYLQSPIFIQKGDEISINYSSGLEKSVSKYPSIEAMSRPSIPNVPFSMTQLITPQKTGVFQIYVKSINIPHVNESSHFPNSGNIDHQNEFVEKFEIFVNP